MKINWGTSIAIFYSCFVAVMVFMVIKSSQNPVNLVQENYYQKDLDYEAFRSKRQNASQLEVPVSIEYAVDSKMLVLGFPKDLQAIKGTLTFFRPADKYLDQTVHLKLDEDSMMHIPVDEKLPFGKWQIQINWETSDTQFYNEATIII